MSDVKLTDEQLKFMYALALHGPTHRKWLPPANREQDRARQQCKKAKLAKYASDGWNLTRAGLIALKKDDPRHV